MHSSPFIPAWSDLAPFACELWLVLTCVATLIVPFFVRRPNTAVAAVTLAGFVIALVHLVAVGPVDASATGRFAPMLSADGTAFVWKILLLVFSSGIVLLWFASGRADMEQGDGPEYFLLLAAAVLGMALMGSASNLLMIFLAVELASLPSYVLAGFRKTHKLGAEAALKYVLFGAAASSVMIWGLSLLYGLCGTLNLYGHAATDGRWIPGVAEAIANQPEASGLLLAALLAVLVGIAFKVSAVPFHFWCPDVFEGAAIDVTAFLSVASKGAGLVLLVRFVAALGESAGFGATTASVMLAGVIGVMGALTATVGNTAAYVQTNLKRLLAYSSIAHAGYMLCAAALFIRGRSAAPVADAVQSLLFYLAVYMFMNLGAFAVASAVARRSGDETLAAFRGLGRRSPWVAAAMALCCLSLIGVPPLAGFTAKFNLMAALGSNGGWWWALVAAIAVNTLLSVYYYARILRAMYLETADETEWSTPAGTRLAGGLAVASAAMLLALFVGSNVLARLTGTSAALRSASPPPTGVAMK